MRQIEKVNLLDKKGDNMKDKKVVFMGTPLYSVPVLEMLIENCTVVGVVTQPDKEVGRKKILTPCPVKEAALKHGIKVLSPEKLKEEYRDIIELNPDIIVTCAYGQILPEELIYYPKYDTINVHASLLPKYRGGAPIHRAIINGEKETGITIMYTDKGMDSGDIIAKKEVSISTNDTYDIVSEKMSKLGASLLLEVLPSVFDGTCSRENQGDDFTLAKVIKREDEHIDFNKIAIDVHNKIRGLSSVPGSYAILNDQNIKIFLSSLDDVQEIKNITPGTITRISKDGIFVACKDKEIKLLKLQVPGKKPMMVKDYLNGINKDSLIGQVFK